MIILGVASSGGLLSKGSNRDEARYMRRDRSIRGCEEQRIERRGEERGRWRCRKARATGQRTIIREMELARAINGGEGVEKFWSWRFNSEDEDEPSKSPHRQRCLRTGSGIGTGSIVLYGVLSYCWARCHAPPMSLGGPQQGREGC
jgi:hypothetical protein